MLNTADEIQERRVIRAACHYNPPWVPKCIERNLTKCKPSIDLDYFLAIMKSVGITTMVTPVNESVSDDALLRDILGSGAADATCCLHSIGRLDASNTSSVLDMVSPVMEDQPVFILSKRRFGTFRRGIIVSVTTTSLWVLTASIFIICILLRQVLNRYSSWLKIIGETAMIAQGYVIVVLLGVYANYLTVAFCLKTETVPFRTLGELLRLLESKQCTILQTKFWEIHDFEQPIFGSYERKHHDYLEQLLKNHTEFVESFAELLHRIRTSTDCLIGVDWKYNSIIHRDSACGLLMFSANFVQKNIYTFFLRKDYRYHDEVMNAFTAATSTELINHKAENVRHFITRQYGTACSNYQGKKRPLEMSDYQDLLKGYAILVITSIVICFCEVILHRKI